MKKSSSMLALLTAGLMILSGCSSEPEPKPKEQDPAAPEVSTETPVTPADPEKPEPQPEIQPEEIQITHGSAFMVDGTLYAFTGISYPERECGVTDGELTSTVSPDQMPSNDGESNFGLAPYQVGGNGLYYVPVEGEWYEFAPENPTGPVNPNVDYNSVDMSQWFYMPETDDETIQKLIEIDSVQQGTAGGSLKAAIAGVRFIEMTQDLNFPDAFAQYTGEMNELQLDFFSFQLERAYEMGMEIFGDYDNMKPLLEDAGCGDFDISLYVADELDQLYRGLTGELASMGVSNQWKNFPELEPFAPYLIRNN